MRRENNVKYKTIRVNHRDFLKKELLKIMESLLFVNNNKNDLSKSEQKYYCFVIDNQIKKFGKLVQGMRPVYSELIKLMPDFKKNKDFVERYRMIVEEIKNYIPGNRMIDTFVEETSNVVPLGFGSGEFFRGLSACDSMTLNKIDKVEFGY